MKPQYKVLIIIVCILILALIIRNVTDVLTEQIKTSKYMANLKTQQLKYQYELESQQIESESGLFGWLKTLL